MVKKAFKRLQILLAIIFTIIGTFVLFLPNLYKRSELFDKNKELLAKIEKLEKEIENLRQREISLQQDPYYVEKLARNKLGYSAPDEIIYQFDK